jgi:hypothetical protein
MTKDEAMKILENAPRGDTPSKINPNLTMTQCVDIVTKGIVACDGKFPLADIFEKRVLQVSQNRIRPEKS